MFRHIKARIKFYVLLWQKPGLSFLFSIPIFLFFASFAGAPWGTSQTPYFNYLADAFLHHQLYFRLMPGTTTDLINFKGLYYIYWPPFPAILSMPGVALFGVAFSDILFTIFFGSVNVALVTLILADARKKGIIACSELQCALLVIFFTIGTVHLNMAPLGKVWFTSLVIGVFCVAVAYWATIRFTGWPAFLITGLAISAATATRYPLILAGIWPAWYLLKSQYHLGTRKLLINIAFGLTPLLLTGILLAWYNFARFGNILDYGYAYHNMSNFFKNDYKTYGAFNLHYVPINLYYEFIRYPFPLNIDTAMGGSLFLLSPVFFALFWGLFHERHSLSAWILLITIFFVSIPILLLMGTGWVQFGPRYTLDFIIPMMLLTAMGVRYWPNKLTAALIIVSAVHYLIGTILLSGA